MRERARRRTVAVMVAVVAVAFVLALAGCGGTSGGPAPQSVGSVTGVVRDLEGHLLGGLEVAIGGITVVSAPNTGAFTIGGLAPGAYNITVVDPTGLTKVLGTLPPVTVVGGNTTNLTAPIVMAPDGPPPNPPA